MAVTPQAKQEHKTGEQSSGMDAINFRQLFPWLHLFRAFWIAADIQKLVLAAVALWAISVGSWIFGFLPFAPDPISPETDQPVRSETVRDLQPTVVEKTEDQHAAGWPWEIDFGYDLYTAAPLSELDRFREAPIDTFRRLATNWQLMLRPVEHFVRPATVLFHPHASWSQLAYAWTELLWALMVWAIFGGALTRMCAVQFASDQKLGMIEAIRFSSSKFLSFLSAPLLPFAGIGLFWSLCLLGGVVGRIPYVGPWVVGIFWGIALVFGFLMALILIGITAGWPLMFATISVEGSDGFDGLSRSYGYVFEQPWYYLWLIFIAIVFGSIVTFFVFVLANLLIYLAVWGVSWGMGTDQVSGLFGGTTPSLIGRDVLPIRGGSFDAMAEKITTNPLAVAWMYATAALVAGFVYSYFWTAVTIIYFLLRRTIDANDLNEVYLEQDGQDELLPLVAADESQMSPAETEIGATSPPEQSAATQASTLPGSEPSSQQPSPENPPPEN